MSLLTSYCEKDQVRQIKDGSISFQFEKSFIVWLDVLPLTLHSAPYPVISKIKI